MSTARFPLHAAPQGWKRLLQRAGGELLCMLRPGRVRELLNPAQVPALGRLDYWMLGALNRRAERHGTIGVLDHIHQHFWQSDEATQFQSAEGRSRFQRFLAAQAAQITGPFFAALAAQGTTKLIEIGPGTGEVLNYWAEHCPALTELIGLECNAGLVARAQAAASDKRVRFVAGDGLELMRRYGGPGTAFWSYGGVLEYFSTDKLRDYFGWIQQQAHPAVLALIEPLGSEHLLGSGPLSMPYGSERSYSHDYRRLAEQAGLSIRFCAESQTGSQRWLLLVAETTNRTP